MPVAAALLAALTAAHAALGPRYGGELTLAVAPFGSTEPRVAHALAERMAVGLVHETLLRLDPDGSVRPALASAFASSAEGREWRFTMDPHARFHDDTPVIASAAVLSLRRFLRSESSAAAALAAALEGGAAFRSGQSSELPGLGVAPADEQRLLVRLSRSSSIVLPALTSPAAAVDSPGGGAGPFAPVLDVPGRRLLARAHPGHVRGRPFLDLVLLVARPRSAQDDASFADAGEPRASATLLLVLDASKPPFASASARAAVESSIDRADLAGRPLAGGQPRFGLLEEPGSARTTRPPALRLEASMTLSVEEAVPPPVSQRIVAWLTSLGLRTGVRVVAGAEARRTGASARLFLFLPEVADPGLVLREAAGLAGSEALQALCDAADAEPDPARRRGLLREIEEKLLAGRTLLPLASLPFGVAAPLGVHGMRFDAAGRLVVEDAWREPR